MEVFVEKNVILPLRIGLEFLGAAVHRPPPGFIAQKNPSQPVGDFPCHLEQVHRVARASRTLNLEVVAVIKVEGEQGADQQYVHWHPYWPAPVGVSAEHAS